MNSPIIVITGASRGLGKALAKLIKEKGKTVVISSKNADELKVAAAELGVQHFVADVTKEEDLRKLAEEVSVKMGKIDMWINNAGIWMPHAGIMESNMSRAHELMEVNFFGTVLGTRTVLPYMKKAGEGTIVNIVSASALAPRPHSAMYAASKAAAKSFTDSLREEVRESGLKVIGVYPGGIKTDLFQDQKPADYDGYMDVNYVAEKIVENIFQENAKEELLVQN